MKTKVTVSNQPRIVTYASTSTVRELALIGDVVAVNPPDGALLQYDALTKTWVATSTLDQSGLTINCGNY
jgi:hypothetical protein